jgi:hypothetical protein
MSCLNGSRPALFVLPIVAAFAAFSPETFASFDPVAIPDPSGRSLTITVHQTTVPCFTAFCDQPVHELSVNAYVPRVSGLPSGGEYQAWSGYVCWGKRAGEACGPATLGLDFGRTGITNSWPTVELWLELTANGELVRTPLEAQIVPIRPLSQAYTIKLLPVSGYPESPATLTSVEPGKPATLVAQVYDQNGQLVPDVSVRLEADVVENSGGHQHPNAPDRPKGNLGGAQPTPHVITGNTGSDGFSFSFNAPALAGDHTITATCTDGKKCTQEGPKQVCVGLKELRNLSASSEYELIGSTDTHPHNHYLTDTAVNRVVVLSALYRGYLQRLFPDADLRLHLNDTSLEHLEAAACRTLHGYRRGYSSQRCAGSDTKRPADIL